MGITPGRGVYLGLSEELPGVRPEHIQADLLTLANPYGKLLIRVQLASVGWCKCQQLAEEKNMVCIIVDSKSPHRELSNHIRYTTN